jgi:ATP-dependent exoDNAse (exonuclease V) beta subunit
MELLGRRFDILTGKALQADLHVNVTTSQPPLQSEPSQTTGRQSLKNILEKAEKKAIKGEGRLPKYLAPVAPDRAARRQYSFSRLSGALHGDCPDFRGHRREALVDENGTVPFTSHTEDSLEPALDPLGLGTLIHAVLEEVDFANPGDFAAIVRRHASLHLAQADVDLDKPIDMIGRFLDSPRAAQIASAEEVHRELEFILAWPPGNALPGARYLQGFIDCLYRDQAGGWHIIDYKTNNITAKTLQHEAAKYEMQMLIYAMTAEKILKHPPVELALCFLRPGLEYQFPWNDKTRKRAVDMVNKCLP